MAPTVEEKANPTDKTVRHKVKAIRNLQMDLRTASGYLTEMAVPFVALPSLNAVGHFVRVEANNRSTLAIVLDAGPFRDKDDEYVFGGEKPAQEVDRNPKRRAGIVVGPAVCRALRIFDDATEVAWEFVV
jgi:hypothetical protein